MRLKVSKILEIRVSGLFLGAVTNVAAIVCKSNLVGTNVAVIVCKGNLEGTGCHFQG